MPPAEEQDDQGELSSPSRRQWLTALGVTALSVAAAGCSGEEHDTPTRQPGNDTSQPFDDTTGQRAGRPIFAGPTELQDRIDLKAASKNYGYNRRRKITLNPFIDYTSDLLDLPIKLRRGITLDLNGNDIVVSEDTDVFHLHGESYLRNGRIKYLDAGTSYSSRIFDIDGKRGQMGIGNQVRIQNLYTLGFPGNNGVVFHLDGTKSPVAGHLYQGLLIRNPGEAAIKIRCRAGGEWTNSCYWYNTVIHGGRVLFDFHSEESNAPVRGHYFQGMAHPSSEQTEWLATLSGSSDCASNKFDLLPAWDLRRCSKGIVRLTGNVQRNVFYDSMQQDVPNADYIKNRKWVNEADQSNAWVNDIDGRVY